VDLLLFIILLTISLRPVIFKSTASIFAKFSGLFGRTDCIDDQSEIIFPRQPTLLASSTKLIFGDIRRTALDAGGQGLCRASRLVIAENQTLFCVDSDQENSVVRGHIMHRSAVPVYEQRTIYQQQQAIAVDQRRRGPSTDRCQGIF